MDADMLRDIALRQWPLLVLAAIAVNMIAFAMFGWDKYRARNGMWRVSEGTLLLVAFLGGWIGAKAGQRYFRHKTSKQPFGNSLNLILPVQLAIAVFALYPPARDLAADMLALLQRLSGR